MRRVAIVTGGASGIGAALCDRLVSRGAQVVVADVDEQLAAGVAKGLDDRGPGRAEARALDVRDAAAVQAVVDDAVARHGRLDAIFNNAGIGMGGDIRELTTAHWERVIDVNLRGVVHGVHAAYPVMCRQGFGHIVNTASATGLFPTPRLVPYAATKWGVVGLSLSLRYEAAENGVKVSVVCPGGIDTPILDKGIPDDLPAVPSAESVDAREAIRKASGGKLYPPEAMAVDILRGMARNKAVIVAPTSARLMWLATRLSPALFGRVAAAHFQRQQSASDPSTAQAGRLSPPRGGMHRT